MNKAVLFGKEHLQPLIKKCLILLLSEDGPPSLPPEVCKGLMEEPPQDCLVMADMQTPPTEDSGQIRGYQVLLGYPDYPLYKRLSDSTASWMVTGSCPVFELPEMYLLNEQELETGRRERLEAAGRGLTDSTAHSHWDSWSDVEKTTATMDYLKRLGVRGVLDLLGVRQTCGSCNAILPPAKETLLNAFTARHSVSARLTVGARALSKHCHRDDSVGWWGQCSGTEEAKNRHAVSVVQKIIREAAWINLHTLPHDVKVVEMRTTEGYGARWLHDGSEFRGFLEPQMLDGHAVGWRH